MCAKRDRKRAVPVDRVVERASAALLRFFSFQLLLYGMEMDDPIGASVFVGFDSESEGL